MFYNHIPMSTMKLLSHDKTVQEQDKFIFLFICVNIPKQMTAWDIYDGIKKLYLNTRWANMPITSIRRALTTMSDPSRPSRVMKEYKFFTRKVDVRISGPYNAPCYTWELMSYTPD